ncbi:MAG: hypothetical protein A2Y00_07675 [Omnitrophica WOR_2 bacterium GWF2_43_52]|nr:MAG: hypothetical protein A2062_01660 [Omnitrophica WOR_2 bacterium GWA2_44_7]OGX16604.1 MAG: hypothetical protein A2Y01_01295 [Omnitrophica WOR_2 bacterium GWC2_44_8]OGX21324.1 MAG: hypothetical protein A2Y00_07675 [Omnitrophica WOR_2 bacterium GWF2_43_52]HAH22058.1 hypothetical protein [Candidatus Omnitrophota bacterium]HBG62735.1 hypothetical protein [Candidatus Omnitrophota bacterium]
MKKIAFTLIEVMVAIIILTVVVSLSIASYEKTVRSSKDKACLLNLQVLQKAVDIYTMETDTLPTTLSQLTPQQIYLAYQTVTGTQRENPCLAFLRNHVGIKPAWGIPLPQRYYGSNPKTLKCPLDTSTDPSSYVLRTDSSDENLTFTRNATTGKVKLMKDSSYSLLDEGTYFRHKDGSGGTYQNGITPGGIKGKTTGAKGKVEKANNCDTNVNGKIEDSECTPGPCLKVCKEKDDDD